MRALFVVVSLATLSTAIYGAQGGTMVAYRLRMSGSDVPGCVAQAASLELETGDVVAALNAPLSTYPEANGARSTNTNYLIFSDRSAASTPRPVRLRVVAGGTEVVRSLTLVSKY